MLKLDIDFQNFQVFKEKSGRRKEKKKERKTYIKDEAIKDVDIEFESGYYFFILNL